MDVSSKLEMLSSARRERKGCGGGLTGASGRGSAEERTGVALCGMWLLWGLI